VRISYIVVPAAVAFFVSYVGTSTWIEVARRAGYVSRDMNKPGEVYAVSIGGIWAVMGMVFGLLAATALRVYSEGFDVSGDIVDDYFALSMLTTLAGFIGFVDDVLGWKRGLKPIYRVVLTVPIALPLMVIKAGSPIITLPLVGAVNIGYLYPLLLVPVGVMGASNAFNMIAGYNGLEALMATTLSAFMALLGLFRGVDFLVTASTVGVASMLAFLRFNWFPAKAFPGNCLTYAYGAYYAGLAIIGNAEKFAIMQFALYFFELLLFLRGLAVGVYKENFGRVNTDGSLDEPYNKIFSLTHLAIRIAKKVRGRAYEPDVVAVVTSMQMLISASSLILVLSELV